MGGVSICNSPVHMKSPCFAFPQTRRHFLRHSALGAGLLAVAAGPARAMAALTKAPSESFHGLKIGMASYTFREFSLDDAIKMTRKAGVKYITLKDFHLPMKSSQAQREEARKKVVEGGLVLMGCGVVYMNNDENEIRAAFDYAKQAGMPTMVCSPDPTALDLVEKFAKEYDIRIAIHNHGPGDKKYPSPLDVFRLVKDRDSRMGICMDVGHTVRIGQDPVAVINECASRLYDFHMKDVTAAVKEGKAIEVGKGIIDIPGVLKALLKIKYSYHVALEYQANSASPMPGVLGSYAYIRKVLATLPG